MAQSSAQNSPSPPSKRIRYARSSDTRARILAAALAEASESGFHKTSVAKIAERAGVAVGNLHYHFGSRRALLRELIVRAVAQPRLYDPDGPDGRLMAVILDQLERLAETPLHLPIPGDPRLRRITDALMKDPADGRRLSDWAATAGASSRTLARLFVATTGLTFGAWRQQARLLHAMRLLAHGEPVTTVALEVGYESPSAFVSAFACAFGTTPGRYYKTGEAGARTKRAG